MFISSELNKISVQLITNNLFYSSFVVLRFKTEDSLGDLLLFCLFIWINSRDLCSFNFYKVVVQSKGLYCQFGRRTLRHQNILALVSKYDSTTLGNSYRCNRIGNYYPGGSKTTQGVIKYVVITIETTGELKLLT